MQVAILCGGKATRLQPATKDIPKSLIEVNGKPFLQYQLDFIRDGGVTDVVLCIGYLGEQIEEYFGDGKDFGVGIRYSRERERLMGTAGALKNAEGLLKDEFFVLYGDSYLFLDFGAILSYFSTFDKLGLMTVYKNHDRYDASNVVVEGNLVKWYSKERQSKDMVYIDYGASVLRKRTLELVPSGQPYSLVKLFNQMTRRGEFLAYEVKQRFFEIGSPDGLRDFRDYVARGLIK